MTYKSIMVHLELNGDNEGVLNIAADLAVRFKSAVIGIAAAQPMQILYEEGWTVTDVVTADRTEIKKELAACKAQFYHAMQERVTDLEWRGCITYDLLADYIADEARSADLIVTGKDIGGSMLDNSRRVNIGQLAMKAGRPILLVPQGVTSLPMRNVIIGWKEARESRRAAADAMSLLPAAGRVTVLTVAGQPDLITAGNAAADVVHWLSRHDVEATLAVVSSDGSELGGLNRELKQRGCDLLVAGAFGHNRLGEWAFGGATNDILLDPEFCVLLSH